MADMFHGKFVIPTGYESEEAKLALKRKIADALMSAGLSSHQGMRSPFEALGQMAQAFVGKRLADKAAGGEDELGRRIRGDYDTARAGLNADVDSGMDPAAIVKKYSGNPMLDDQIKPYVEALTKRLTGGEDLVDTGGMSGFQPKRNFIGKPMPNDPNKPVWLDEQGNATVNGPLATAHMYSNPNLVEPGAMPTTSPIPNAGQAPGPPAPVGATPSPSAVPAGADIDLSKLTPEEREILKNEIRRRGGLPASNEMPFGSPLDKPAARPADGIVNGKQYWMINGVPYDNPEGK